MSSTVVLITGALTGIGRAAAVAIAKTDADIVVAGRREAEGAARETTLREMGVKAACIKTDGRHDDEVRDLVDATVARFGRLDIAVNNAAIRANPGFRRQS